MGNQPSFEQHHDFKDIQTNYIYEKKFTDNRFGEIKLLQKKNSDEKIFQKDFSSNTPKEFEDYIQQIKDATVLAHPNILRVFGYNSKKEDMFCADFYKVSLFFESFESDLEQEISRRRANKERFDERELWYILESVSSAAAYLHEHNIPHRDIRPYNVLINADHKYKISATNLFRLSYNPLYFENFEGLEAQARYYSPESLEHIKTPAAKRTGTIDEYKNDSFALGMTMLEAGLLEKVDAYDFDKKTISRSAIDRGLSKLRENYSEDFVRTIENTLDFDPETRLGLNRLDRELSNFRRDIKEKARNSVTGSPARQSVGRIEAIHQTPVEQPVSSGYPNYQADDLDARVREAVRRSEAVIKKSSPTKYSNKHLDPYIQAYLRDEVSNQQNVLVAISPYLTSESKYTTTLTIEQPNYGRESQPINFSQFQQREDFGDSVKRSAFADPTAQLVDRFEAHQTASFGQHTSEPQVTETLKKASEPTQQATTSYGQDLYKPATNYGTTSYEVTTTTYGVGAGDLKKSETGAAGTLSQSGTNQYGVSSYGQDYKPATNYGTTSYEVTTTTYGVGTGELKKSETGAATGALSQSGANQYGASTSYGQDLYKPANYGTTSYEVTTTTYGVGTGDLKKSETGAAPGTLSQSGTNQYGVSSSYGQDYKPATNYGTTSYEVTTTTYGVGTGDLKKSETGAATGALSQSGTNQAGASNYASHYSSTYQPANYGTTTTTTYNYTNYGVAGAGAGETAVKDYATEADELTRQIEERLSKSRTQFY